MEKNNIEEIQSEKIEKPRERKTLKQPEDLEKAKKFSQIAKGAIYLLIFLLPLFFLPWTANVLDFNKQALLFSLVFIALVCWLISVLISNKLEINLSFLNLPVAALLLTSGISTIFSLSRYGSFWGWPLIISSSFFSLLGFVIFYLIISNLFKKNEIPFLFLTLFLSGFLATLFFIFQLFGKFIFPFDFTKVTSFNTIGTVNSLAIYLSVLLICLLPLFLFVRRFFKIILAISGLTFLFALFLINFKTAWLILLIGVVVLFIFGVVNLKKRVKTGPVVTLMMIFLIIALFLTFFRFSIPGAPAIPVEISSSQKAGLVILKQLPAKSLLLGSGPGTFIYDWSKYKPVDINQTIFWPIRFGQAASEILDRTITTGILGILAFFFLLFSFLKLIFTSLLKKTESQDILGQFLAWGALASFAALVAVFFFYQVNLSILFVFWLLIGCLALLEKKESPEGKRVFYGVKKVLDFSTSPNKVLVFSFFFVLILVSGIGLSIIYAQKYFAEVKYFQGLRAWQVGNNILSTDYLLRAANFNPQMDLYWRDLSQIYLVRVNELLIRTDLSQEERNSQAQSLIVNAINAAGQTTNINPRNVANWSVRGFIYRNMIGILEGADDWAIKSYQKTAELEPANPYFFTEIGLSYLSKSDLMAQQQKEKERTENLRLAQENFEKAINLKPDYAPAHFQIAMIHIREGNIQEAINRLEITKQVAPFDTGLAFQLGLLYYNANQFDKAKAEFERAILLDQNYSNARYFLGLIYDREGNKKVAIEQFEKIEQFNPENQEVKKILSNLRGGKPALEGVVPGQPPIEEKTPELLEK